MHEEQFRIHNLEIDEFSKRNAQLNEQNVRFDIECGRLTEELQVALGRLEQLRNDCANLRAEKKIWEVSEPVLFTICIWSPRLNYHKGIQGRLLEENRTLSMERSYNADLMSNVQKMHNDLERSGENDRRRLEGQLRMLENQTCVRELLFPRSIPHELKSEDLRSQLLQERESVRHISLQKDIELKELQTRIEKNVCMPSEKKSHADLQL
jgi:nucleoprotein TPR